MNLMKVVEMSENYVKTFHFSKLELFVKCLLNGGSGSQFGPNGGNELKSCLNFYFFKIETF